MNKFVKLEMKVEIDEDAFDTLKRVEHHVEELLDLDSYPEIKHVFGVQVTECVNVGDQ